MISVTDTFLNELHSSKSVHETIYTGLAIDVVLCDIQSHMMTFLMKNRHTFDRILSIEISPRRLKSTVLAIGNSDVSRKRFLMKYLKN